MYLTIKDVLHLFQDKAITLAAGSGGLERTVANVNIMDAPDIWNWVKPGDLILTTGYAIKDDASLQERLVRELAASGAAGLGIKTKRFLPAVPENMRKAADELDFPILELPLTMTLAEIMNPVISSIAARQSYLLQRSNEIHQALTKEAISGGGLSSIVACLGRLTQCPVGCYDTVGGPLVKWLPEHLPGVDDAILKALESSLAAKDTQAAQKNLAQTRRPHTTTLTAGGHDFIRSSFAIMSSNEFFGHISIIQTSDVFLDINCIALEHACTVAALDFLKQKAIAESRRLHSRDLLEHILFGDLGHQMTADLIAGSKLATTRYYQCIVVEIGESEAVNTPVFKTLLYKTAQQVVAARYPLALVSERAGQLIALVAAASALHAGDLYEKLHHALRDMNRSVPISLGVGPVVSDISLARGSYHDALACLEIGRLTKGPGKITYLNDIASYQILASSGAAAILDHVCGAALTRLEDSDKSHGTELIKTLEKYLEHDKNLTATAKELFIHRNTLTNRLDKIADLTGISLDDRELAFNLRLALRWRKLRRNNH